MPGDKGGKQDPLRPSDKPTKVPEEFEKPPDKPGQGKTDIPGQRISPQK